MRDETMASPSESQDLGTTDSEDRATSVGRKLRAMRQRRGWTLAELSTRCGLSLGMLSQVERGLSSPSIRSLQKLAGIFGIPVGWFFSDPEPAGAGPNWVLRRPQRRVLDLPAKGITKELLVPEGDGSMELMMITVEPGGSSGEAPYSHTGEDAGTVIEGMLELEVDGVCSLLQTGDSFRFASTLPHRFSNPGTLRCVVVWAVTPPLY
ncbi:cupin domain-containing protein [Roseomonas sp. KE0001]|uniref:cupin domain-containing protein n=1 Tax=unclassified Roseomonas TaxID=2617492 RepID=UPI0018DFB191|nr:cupin domain-containing protein [Roseomonas sp. KE0001]MBI0433558.1 cupin domain-containing protein [Roseomonas sp. KE0001]